MIAEAVTWLCQSPRRLATGAVVILAIVLLGGSAVFGNGAKSGTSPGDSTSAVSATTAPAAQVPDADPAVSAAVAFVRLWSRLKPGETKAQWHSALVPLSTKILGESLSTTSMARLPGVGPSGQPVVNFLSQTSSQIAVPLSDGSSVLVTTVSGDSGPLVSDIEPNVGDN